MNLIDEMAKLGYDMETFPGGSKWTPDMGVAWPYRKQAPQPKITTARCACGSAAYRNKRECLPCFNARTKYDLCACGGKKMRVSRRCKECRRNNG